MILRPILHKQSIAHLNNDLFSNTLLNDYTCLIPGFPKLLVHRYPLDTEAGLHVPQKFCDISLKKKGFQFESAINFPPIYAQNQGDF